MSYSITAFAANTTNPLAALDNNFTTFGALVPIPCVIAGTNTLTLTPNGAGLVPTPTLAQYTTDNYFVGIASATNTGATTAQVGALGVLNIYKDGASGPVVLSGNEIIAKNAIGLLYDGALNSGAGGFHLISNTAQTGLAAAPSSVQINGGSTLTMALSGSASLTFTVAPGWSSQDQTFTLTGLPPTIPLVGDFVQVTPPSLAATGISYAGYVTAVGSLSSVASVSTVAIRQINSASASLASNSGSYRYLAIRSVP